MPVQIRSRRKDPDYKWEVCSTFISVMVIKYPHKINDIQDEGLTIGHNSKLQSIITGKQGGKNLKQLVMYYLKLYREKK